ncbi:MAG TPA: SgcJ/EcaC family oxidoreductase [Sphingomicrobium sp.]
MPDTGEDERAIRVLVDTWMNATNSGDLATVLDLMTDDVLFMTPGQAPFGKEEFRARSQGLKGVEIDGRAEIREVEVLGDWAWIRNHIDVTMGEGGARRSGYTLTILKKGGDGCWRLFRDANLVS